MRFVGKKSVSSGLSSLLLCAIIATGIAVGLAIWVYFLPQDLVPEHINMGFGALRIRGTSGINLTSQLIASLSAVGVVTMYLLYQLRLLFANFANERIFAYDNAARLRNTGLAMLVLSAVYPLLELAFVSQIHDYLVQQGIEAVVTYQLSPSLVLSGLLILVLAEVFRVATSIAEEHKLTI